MKKTFLLILMLVSLNAFSDDYFFVNVRNGDLVTAGSTTATPIYITDASDAEQRGRVITYTITVVSGTIKFGVGSVGANSAANVATTKILITCKNGELYFQAASGADTFTVTAV